MIPSDHFVRFYNEVFKSVMERGYDDLVAYWRELGRLQSIELTERFRQGGLRAAFDYWSRIRDEENCEADLELHDDYLEMRMNKCPSLSKAMDSDAGACQLYCDHCMAWVEPTVTGAGLHPVADMISRQEPRCVWRIYKDQDKADAFERTTRLPSRPYNDPLVKEICDRRSKEAKTR